MAQSMESLTSPITDDETETPLWPTSGTNGGDQVSSKAKLDRLACFAAISDTSVGLKRQQLQRRHLADSRRLSQPVTLRELDKAEAYEFQLVYQSSARF